MFSLCSGGDKWNILVTCGDETVTWVWLKEVKRSHFEVEIKRRRVGHSLGVVVHTRNSHVQIHSILIFRTRLVLLEVTKIIGEYL